MNREAVLTEEQLVERVFIDVPMPISYASLDLAEQLEQLEPFGTGNPKPVFAERGLQLESIRSFANGRMVQLALRDEKGNRVYVKSFRGEALINDIKMCSDMQECIMYQLSVNEFRGDRTAECQIIHYRKTAEEKETV